MSRIYKCLSRAVHSLQRAHTRLYMPLADPAPSLAVLGPSDASHRRPRTSPPRQYIFAPLGRSRRVRAPWRVVCVRDCCPGARGCWGVAPPPHTRRQPTYGVVQPALLARRGRVAARRASQAGALSRHGRVGGPLRRGIWLPTTWGHRGKPLAVRRARGRRDREVLARYVAPRGGRVVI